VAARSQEYAEGEETAWEAVGKFTFAGGAGVITLWRGAKGSERFVRKSQSLFRALGEVKTSEVSYGQGQRGSEEPIRSLASLSTSSENLANLKRGGLFFGDEKQSLTPVTQTFEADGETPRAGPA